MAIQKNKFAFNPLTQQLDLVTDVSNAFEYSVQSINSDITLAIGTTYLLDTSANRTLTLPIPLPNAFIVVKDATGNAEENVITFDGDGSFIDGEPTYVMGSEYESITLVSDGSNWFLV